MDFFGPILSAANPRPSRDTSIINHNNDNHRDYEYFHDDNFQYQHHLHSNSCDIKANTSSQQLLLLEIPTSGIEFKNLEKNKLQFTNKPTNDGANQLLQYQTRHSWYRH